jgi:radical SAM superfamily enzyme YgiQ (UPF0313 family)
LKIFLADLTYTTVTIATEALPINIGYIASYCIKRFGSKVDIKLFKYIEELEKAINESPPDILGLSNYVWSQNVSNEMFKLFTKKNPDGLKIWGGPNFPIDMPSQKKFFENFKDVDVYIPIDGEIGFSNLVEKALQMNTKEMRSKILQEPIDGCMIKNPDGNLLYTIEGARIRNLDEIPSPYLTGILDHFFDDKLVPMLQTNRGCPFLCTFCTDGRESVNQVNRFGKQRVKDELDYIAKHVKEDIHSLYISDLNFGMLPGDLETCKSIVEIQKKYHYPEKINATTGKNNQERIIESIKSLNGTMLMSMSVQSMDEQVLTNIKRANISAEKMVELSPTIHEYGVNTSGEIIMGMPGQSYASVLDTIRQLIYGKVDDIIIHACMMLPGSEMATPVERSKWKLETKFRILPMDFTVLGNGKKICEIDEIVVGSKDMTFDDYLALRMIAFTLSIVNRATLFEPLLKFLKQQKIDVSKLFFQMVEERKSAPKPVELMYDRFNKVTVDELYDSPEEIISLIQKDEEYQKLIEGRGAINVIKYHGAAVLSECMDEWTEYALSIANDLLRKDVTWNEEIEKQFHDVGNYCRGRCHNPLGKDRMQTNPEFTFYYDIIKWLSDNSDNMLLDECKLPEPVKTVFSLTNEQYKFINDTLDLYGDNLIGKTKARLLESTQTIWRKPITQH